MTRIIGMVCDGCGAIKSTRYTSFKAEDDFPPASWYSVCQWIEDGVADNIEFHACSVDCLKGVSKHIKSLIKENKKSEKVNAKNELTNLEAYCIMCKDKHLMVDGVIRISDSGRRMATGKCEQCGAKVNRILGKVD